MKTTNPGDPSSPVPGKLIALDGPDRGKIFELEAGRQYVAGRSEECGIRIDASDKTVSRKHALLTLSGNTLTIENLSQTNPVQVKGKAVSRTTLKHKGQFQIGAGLFTFEASGRPDSGKVGKSASVNLKIVIPAVVLLVGMVFFLIIGRGEKDTLGTGDADITRPADIQTDAPTAIDRPADMLPKVTGIPVSDVEKEKVEEHFRQGMFFYDTGNLVRAIEEWSRVIAIWPDHREAQTWYLRAEKELDDKVREHYQNAMMHYKYMRYQDAAREFGIVVELSRNKSSDHYINALRYLNELRGK
jgi:pSer/pThr/pTyr-binding forkhead associated (FHA) protein